MFTNRSARCRELICLTLAFAPAFQLHAAELRDVQPSAIIGEPVALAVYPDTVRLSGPRAMQQVVVTGRYSDGAERDLTPFCTLSTEAADVVTIAAGGFLQPRKDGEALLVVRAGSLTATVPVIVENFDKPRPVTFRHDLIAVLGVAGCNQGACHGIPSGRGSRRRPAHHRPASVAALAGKRRLPRPA